MLIEIGDIRRSFDLYCKPRYPVMFHNESCVINIRLKVQLLILVYMASNVFLYKCIVSDLTKILKEVNVSGGG